MSKKPSFIQRFGRQHFNGSQKLLRSALNQFHRTLLLISDRGSKKRLVQVRSGLLGPFFNTLAAYYKYSRWNRENLSQQVAMGTSRKLKNFFRFLISFLKSMLNFEYFEKKTSVSKIKYYGNY